MPDTFKVSYRMMEEKNDVGNEIQKVPNGNKSHKNYFQELWKTSNFL